jgi:hypothetical protein
LQGTTDQVFAYDYDSSGLMDHLVMYRPASGICWILAKGADGSYSSVYQQGQGGNGNGIGGYDLLSASDLALAYDYDSSGKMDHIVLYRPGTGTIWIVAKASDGSFSKVYQQGNPAGIGGYDLASEADRVIAFDYDSSGKMDHLLLWRPGSGICWIVKKNADGSFTSVFTSNSGIAGFDLSWPQDQIVALDYESTGKMDHLAIYRPSGGVLWIIAKASDGSFNAVYSNDGFGLPGAALDFVGSPSDRAFAFDYDGSGKADHLVIYRQGTCQIAFFSKTNGIFQGSPLYVQKQVEGRVPQVVSTKASTEKGETSIATAGTAEA